MGETVLLNAPGLSVLCLECRVGVRQNPWEFFALVLKVCPIIYYVSGISAAKIIRPCFRVTSAHE